LGGLFDRAYVAQPSNTEPSVHNGGLYNSGLYYRLATIQTIAQTTVVQTTVRINPDDRPPAAGNPLYKTNLL